MTVQSKTNLATRAAQVRNETAGFANDEARVGSLLQDIIDSCFAAGISFFTGAGSPAGVVTANPGSVYLNTNGGAGTTLYIKESGVGTNGGWVAK